MTETALMTPQEQAAIVEQVVLQGDLAKLSPGQRVAYYRAVCQSVGVNPLTRPFDYMFLNGKLQLYAKAGCADQIRTNKGLSIDPLKRELQDDLYLVTARGHLPDGRTDEATGVVSVAGLKGTDKANAYMKAETKAKRRLTLSLVGLGMLSEEEIEDTPGATRIPVNVETGEIPRPEALPQPEGPKAQHPLVAAGFTSGRVKAWSDWIGEGQPPAQWSADQKTASQALKETLLAAVATGIAVEELTETVQAYLPLDGPVSTNVQHALSQINQMITNFTQDPADAGDEEVPDDDPS